MRKHFYSRYISFSSLQVDQSLLSVLPQPGSHRGARKQMCQPLKEIQQVHSAKVVLRFTRANLLAIGGSMRAGSTDLPDSNSTWMSYLTYKMRCCEIYTEFRLFCECKHHNKMFTCAAPQFKLENHITVGFNLTG